MKNKAPQKSLSKYILVLTVLLCCAFMLQTKHITIFMAGDSTMADKAMNTYPETGWGMPFKAFFDSTVTVTNLAKNGRTTKSFIAEGLWKKIEDNMKPGDYLLIQFGHNDEKPNAVTPELFHDNLLRFVNEARAKQVIPVLITPVARRKFDATGNIQGTHEVFSPIVRKLAADENVALIDLDKESQALLQKFGPENSKYLFNYLEAGEHPNYPKGQKDDTHFSEFGARKMAEIVLADLKTLTPGLNEHITVSHLGLK
jgi:lysophospholipase L1-like esterase